MAVNEIVELIEDEATRMSLADATATAIRGATDRIAKRIG